MGKVVILGVGGAGCNCINTMSSAGIKDFQYIGINTDKMALDVSKADIKVLIGKNEAKGLGTGADLKKGAKCAEENIEDIRMLVKDYERIYIVAGLGGGTGGGSAPIIAKALNDDGKNVYAFAIEPFKFESKKRSENYYQSLEKMICWSEAVITVINDKVLDKSSSNSSVKDMLGCIDKAIFEAIMIIENNFSNDRDHNYNIPEWMRINNDIEV